MKKFNPNNNFVNDGEIPFDSLCNLEIMLDKEDDTNIWYKYSDESYVYSAKVETDWLGIKSFKTIGLNEMKVYEIRNFVHYNLTMKK